MRYTENWYIYVIGRETTQYMKKCILLTKRERERERERKREREREREREKKNNTGERGKRERVYLRS